MGSGNERGKNLTDDHVHLPTQVPYTPLKNVSSIPTHNSTLKEKTVSNGTQDISFIVSHFA